MVVGNAVPYDGQYKWAMITIHPQFCGAVRPTLLPIEYWVLQQFSI